MAECNKPSCSTSSLSDSLASGTRSTTVSSDGKDVEDSGEDASESSSRTSADPESILCFITVVCENVFLCHKKIILLRRIAAYFWSIMAYLWSIIGINCECQNIP